MGFHDQLQVATGVDPALIGVGLFVAMLFVLWALTHLIDRPEIDSFVAPSSPDNERVGLPTPAWPPAQGIADDSFG